MPKDFDGESFFSDCFGIVLENRHKAENVLVKVNDIQGSYIRALPLHHSQKEIESTSAYTVFSYQIRPSYDFRQEILSYGANIEVLEPKWFRDEIANIITEQHTIYGNG